METVWFLLNNVRGLFDRVMTRLRSIGPSAAGLIPVVVSSAELLAMRFAHHHSVNHDTCNPEENQSTENSGLDWRLLSDALIGSRA